MVFANTARRRSISNTALAASLLWACTSEEGAAPGPDACVGAACGASSQDAGPPAARDAGEVSVEPGTGTTALALPCDVNAVVEQHCRTCHTAGGSAPMRLAGAADFRAASPADGSRTVAQSTAERLHTADTKRTLPPAGYPKLSTDELSVLDAWLAAGSPGSTATCADAGSPLGADASTVEPDELECFRFLAHDPSSKDVKYNVGLAPDTYVNMTFVPPWPETRYAVSVKPVIDNAKVLHHWLLFRNATPGPDGLVAPALGAHPDGELITAWAPGGDGLDLSALPDVGYEMPGGQGTSYTMEFHYNSGDLDAKDASGLEVCMFKKKPANTASVSWLGKDNLLVPDTKWIATCDPISDEPIHIVSVMPHMHTSGVHMKATINRANGTKETLHDADFDFEYQKSYPKDVTLVAGDTITTECTYSKPTLFGKATDQEMCYLFTYAYPSGALTQIDPWGYFAHGGNSCLQ